MEGHAQVVSFQKCDVRSEEDVLKAIAAIDKKWPKLQTGGLVHCGGVGMAGKVGLVPFNPECRRQGAE